MFGTCYVCLFVCFFFSILFVDSEWWWYKDALYLLTSAFSLVDFNCSVFAFHSSVFTPTVFICGIFSVIYLCVVHHSTHVLEIIKAFPFLSGRMPFYFFINNTQPQRLLHIHEHNRQLYNSINVQLSLTKYSIITGLFNALLTTFSSTAAPCLRCSLFKVCMN